MHRILRPALYRDKYGYTDEFLRAEVSEDCEIINVDELPRTDEALKELIREQEIDVVVNVANNSRLADELHPLGVQVIGPYINFRAV